MIAFVAGVSKNLCQRNETGRGAKKTYTKEPTLGWSPRNKEQREGGAKVKKNGVFLFTFYGYSRFCIIEVESDGVINSSASRVKY